MDLSATLERVAVSLHASSSANLAYHTAAEVWAWLDQWSRRLSIATRLQVAIRSINAIPPTASYALPAANLSTPAVFDATGYALERITVRNLDAGGPWQATAEAHPVHRFSLDANQGLNVLTLDPPPMLAQTLTVLQTEYPAAIGSGQPILDAPAIAEDYLYFRTVAEARGRIGEAHMPEVASFAGGLADLIEGAAVKYWGAP
jgi:hypothetical protein